MGPFRYCQCCFELFKPTILYIYASFLWLYMTLRVSSIEFGMGMDPKSPNLKVEPKNVTVVVGPNNSGKTETLR